MIIDTMMALWNLIWHGKFSKGLVTCILVGIGLIVALGLIGLPAFSRSSTVVRRTMQMPSIQDTKNDAVLTKPHTTFVAMPTPTVRATPTAMARPTPNPTPITDQGTPANPVGPTTIQAPFPPVIPTAVPVVPPQVSSVQVPHVFSASPIIRHYRPLRPRRSTLRLAPIGTSVPPTPMVPPTTAPLPTPTMTPVVLPVEPTVPIGITTPVITTTGTIPVSPGPIPTVTFTPIISGTPHSF